MLTKRMQAALDLFIPCESAADIGCDHAYLSIALVCQNKAKHVIAADIHSGPLKTAQKHIAGENLTDRIELRRSDGFSGIAPGEIDGALIMGMGGRLIQKILLEGKDVVSRLSGLVAGAQSEIEEFRRFLCTVRFGSVYLNISKETIVFEEGKYYVLMQLIPSGHRQRLSDAEYLFGIRSSWKGDPVFASYLASEEKKRNALLQRLHAQPAGQSVNRKKEQIYRELDLLNQCRD